MITDSSFSSGNYTGLGIRNPGFQYQPNHWVTVWTWANYYLIWYFSFSIWTMEKMITEATSFYEILQFSEDHEPILPGCCLLTIDDRLRVWRIFCQVGVNPSVIFPDEPTHKMILSNAHFNLSKWKQDQCFEVFIASYVFWMEWRVVMRAGDSSDARSNMFHIQVPLAQVKRAQESAHLISTVRCLDASLSLGLAVLTNFNFCQFS